MLVDSRDATLRHERLKLTESDFGTTDGLPIFFGTEQPETCRRCGVRTEFDEGEDGLQVHNCVHCTNRYIVEFEESSIVS